MVDASFWLGYSDFRIWQGLIEEGYESSLLLSGEAKPSWVFDLFTAHAQLS